MFPILQQRQIIWLLSGSLLLPTANADQTTPNQGLHQNTPDLTALVNATVVTEPGNKIENATLILEKGRILRVLENGNVPLGATVIDLQDHYIYSGFIDLYTQYGVENYESESHHDELTDYLNERVGGNASNDAVHAEINWIDSFAADPENAAEWIEAGFTSVQSASFDGIFQGQGALVSLADRIPNDLVYRPHTHHFSSFNKGSSEQAYPNSLMGSMALIRQTLSDANWYNEAQKKPNSNLEYNAALAALADLSEQGVMFSATDDLMLLRASQLFNEFEVPLTALATHYEYARLDEIKKSGVQLVVPLNFPDAPSVGNLELAADASLAKLRHWERAPSNPAALAKSKIPFALTLHGSNSRFWDNLYLAMEHGLSAQTALAALTTEPARFVGAADQLGKIAPGYRADLVVAYGDLFAGGEIRQVWLQGKQQLMDPAMPYKLAGDYHFTIEDHEVNLALRYKEGTLRATLQVGEQDLSLSDLEVAREHINFSLELSEIGLPGVNRFALQRHADKLSGVRVDATGKRTLISTERKKISTAKAAAAKPEPVSYVSQLTYPNRAFGLTSAPSSENVHIKNATIWTSTEQGNLTNSDLLFSGGKIEAIGQNLKTPQGYQVIDAKGKHLTAGIIDEHSHLAISDGVNESSTAVTSEVRIGDVLNPDDPNIYRALAGGVTTAQLLHGSANPIGGQSQVIQLRWGASAEQLKFDSAPATIKFALGENVKQSGWGDKFTIRYPQSRLGVEALMRDYFQAAKAYQASHKAYNELSRRAKRETIAPRIDYRMEALLEILNKERFIHVHSYVASEMLTLLELADDFGITIQTFTHVLEGYKVADELAAHGATASTFADWWAYKFEVFDGIPQNTCLMQQRGVNVSINSDSEDLIRRLNQEAAKSMMYCDMAPEQAWQMITINPAIQLKIDDKVGTLEEGKQADLVLWDHDPLSVYARAETTWISGQRYFDRERDSRMRVQQAKEKQALVQKVLTRDKTKQVDTPSDQVSAPYKLDQPSWHCDTTGDIWKHKHHAGGNA